MARPSSRWTEAHVRRLFWRAGFGATAKEASHWAKRGKGATLAWVMNGGHGPTLQGTRAATVDGHTLDPTNEWGHDVLWWLDRMVRTQRPLVEKMTLFWHDHFATRDQDRPLMLRAEPDDARARARAVPPRCSGDVTADPAMQLFLSLADSDKDAPNENYARELMELFTLGTGYSERDVREAARALTGFKSNWSHSGDFGGIRYDAGRPRPGHEEDLRQTRPLRLDDVLDLVDHAPEPRARSWSRSCGPTSSRAARAARRARGSSRTYRDSGLKIKPVVGRSSSHPQLYADLERAGRWSSARSSTSPARCARRGRYIDARLLDLAARQRWASSRSSRRRSPAGTGGRRGCPPTSCAPRFTRGQLPRQTTGAPRVEDSATPRRSRPWTSTSPAPCTPLGQPWISTSTTR